MNRRDRRTKGKAIQQEINRIKNSQLLKEADISSLPKEVVDALVAGTCENKTLQRKYNSCKKLLDKLINLKLELTLMKEDLDSKRAIPRS